MRQATDIVGAADKRSVDPHHRERPYARSVQHADVRVPASPQLVDGHRTIRTLPHERIKHHDEAFFGGGRSLASCATGHVSGVRARGRERGEGVGCVPSLAWSGRDVKRGVSSLLEAIFFFEWLFDWRVLRSYLIHCVSTRLTFYHVWNKWMA